MYIYIYMYIYIVRYPVLYKTIITKYIELLQHELRPRLSKNQNMYVTIYYIGGVLH